MWSQNQSEGFRDAIDQSSCRKTFGREQRDAPLDLNLTQRWISEDCRSLRDERGVDTLVLHPIKIPAVG
jgi:hypothetical protein